MTTKESLPLVRLSRRQFLVEAATVAAALASGCLPKAELDPTRVQPSETPPLLITPTFVSTPVKLPEATATPEPTENPLIIRLGSIIEKLPGSIYRDLITNYGWPLFSQGKVVYGGVTVPIIRPDIQRESTTGDRFGGWSNFRGRQITGSDIQKCYPCADTDLFFPLPFILTPDEQSELAGQSNFGFIEGAPLIKGQFMAQTPVYSLLAPQIILRQPTADLGLGDSYRLLEDFVLVKEITSLAVISFYLETMVKMMEQKELPTHLCTNCGQTEGLTQFLTIVMSHPGRLVALFDLAGYALGIKAVADTETPSLLQKYSKPWGDDLEAVLARDFGDSIPEIVESAFNWVLTAPETTDFLHAGNIDLIP